MAGITVNKVHLYNTGEGFELGQVIGRVGDTFQGGLVNGVAEGLFVGDRFKSACVADWVENHHCVMLEGEFSIKVKGTLPAKSGMIPLVDADGFIYGAGYLDYTDTPSYITGHEVGTILKSYTGVTLYPAWNLRFVTDGLNPVICITEIV